MKYQERVSFKFSLEFLNLLDEYMAYADVYPYLYIKMYLEGWDQDRNI